MLRNLKEKGGDGYSKSSTASAAAGLVDFKVNGQSVVDEKFSPMPEQTAVSNGGHNEKEECSISKEASIPPHSLPVLPNHKGPIRPSMSAHRAPVVDNDCIYPLGELREAMESQASKIRDLRERLLKRRGNDGSAKSTKSCTDPGR